jgi:shikimate dehydrogenase
MKRLALLGHPVGHSISPAIHNAAAGHLGLEVRYEAIDVPGDALADAVRELRSGAFLGANVTIPHKEAILPLLDELSDEARAVGAVNTVVVRQGGRLEGHNTDVVGFVQPLQDFGERLAGGHGLIFGAGGAARAAAHGMAARLGMSTITICARSIDRARRLVDEFEGRFPAVTWSAREIDGCEDAVRSAALLVNATPLGLHPNTDATPLQDPRLLTGDHIVYDMVYRPLLTRLIRDAERSGAVTLTGLEMLLGQAAAAFTLWTGREMPLDTARRAALAALAPDGA